MIFIIYQKNKYSQLADENKKQEKVIEK